jgi:hypothetical protein
VPGELLDEREASSKLVVPPEAVAGGEIEADEENRGDTASSDRELRAALSKTP